MRRDSLFFLKAFSAFFVWVIAFIAFSSMTCGQGNSITGYFIVEGSADKEIMVNNTPAANTPNSSVEEAKDSVQDSDSSPNNPNMAPLTGSVIVDDDNGQNNQEPGLIERIFGRIISFFRKLL